MRSFQKLYSAALTPRSRVRSNSLYTSAGHTPYPSGFPPGYYAPYPPSNSNGAGGSGGGGAYTNGSSFFDSPPPPAPRISTSRLKGESQTSHSSHGQSSQSTQSSQASHQHAPYSLALTSPHNQHGTHTLLPTANTLSSSYAASYDPTSCSLQGGHPDEAEFVTGRRRRRKGHKYHFDLAAYGMPKRRCGSSSPRDSYLRPSGEPYTDLSVQVGEDAYFLRDNAMGVADGVGGWARVKGARIFGWHTCERHADHLSLRPATPTAVLANAECLILPPLDALLLRRDRAYTRRAHRGRGRGRQVVALPFSHRPGTVTS